MDYYGVILRKLRELNHLTVKQAARQIGRSAGWISQIENCKGAARLKESEFERIVAAYNGEPYRKQFGGWITRTKLDEKQDPREIVFDGSILKYLREKADFTLEKAAKKVGISKGHLSALESGRKRLSLELRNKLLQVYGYSPASFKNFTTEDKRAKNIPVRYKLDILLGKLSDNEIEKVFSYTLESVSGQTTK